MGRSVYCRWCYNKGHNRRTCPEYTESMKERAEAEAESNKEHDCHDTWRQEEYAKRIKADVLLDGTPFNCPKQTNGSGERRCSYCAGQGHNRRTCVPFVGAKQGYLEEAVQYRKDIAKTLPDLGVGIGTLVTVDPRYGDGGDRNHLYMVVGFEWGIITHKTGSDGYRGIQLRSLDVNDSGHPYRDEFIPFPAPSSHENDSSLDDYQQKYVNTTKYWDNIEVVAKVQPKAVKKIIPSNWYETKQIEKSEFFKLYFKDVRSSDYWDNYYTDE